MNTIDGTEKQIIQVFTSDVNAKLAADNVEITRLAILVENKQQQIITLTAEIARLNAIISGTVVTPPPVTTPDLYFAGDMSTVSITGTKNAFDFNWQGWDALKANSLLSSWGMYCEGLPFNYMAINPNNDNGRRCLQSVVYKDDPAHSVARAQAGMTFKDTANLAVYHTSHRMKLNSAFKLISDQFPDAITDTAANWMTIFEIWNKEDPTMSGLEGGSARWSLYLEKAAGTFKPWTWKLRGEYMQPASSQYQSFMKATSSWPVWIDQWFTLDVYMKRGDATNGRMIIKVTPDGSTPTTIIDVTGPTIYPGKPNLPIKYWTPFKLYTPGPVMDFATSRGNSLMISYNDFKWYKS